MMKRKGDGDFFMFIILIVFVLVMFSSVENNNEDSSSDPNDPSAAISQLSEENQQFVEEKLEQAKKKIAEVLQKDIKDVKGAKITITITKNNDSKEVDEVHSEEVVSTPVQSPNHVPVVTTQFETTYAKEIMISMNRGTAPLNKEVKFKISYATTKIDISCDGEVAEYRIEDSMCYVTFPKKGKWRVMGKDYRGIKTDLYNIEAY